MDEAATLDRKLTMTRHLRRISAAVLSAVLVLLSPGLEAPRLFAQTTRAVLAVGRAAACGARRDDPATRESSASPTSAGRDKPAPLAAATRIQAAGLVLVPAARPSGRLKTAALGLGGAALVGGAILGVYAGG